MNRNIDFRNLQDRNNPTMAERKTRSGKLFKNTNTLPEISSQDEDDDMDGDLEAEMEEEEINLKAKKSTKRTSSTSSPAKVEKRKYKKNYGAKDLNPEKG
jgi:hypothetical protein